MTEEIIIDYISRMENIEYLREVDGLKSKIGKDWLCSAYCHLSIGDENIPIILLVPNRFPYNLPIFLLPKYDHLGFLPHVEPNGGICYLEKESIFINIDNPEVVFQASVELAIQTLKDGLNGSNHRDFREEFNAFWIRNEFISQTQFLSLIEIGQSPKKVQILRDNKSGIVINYGADTKGKRKIFFKHSKPILKSGLYIPLKLEGPIVPPKYDTKWQVEEFINWLKPKVLEENWKEIIENLLDKKSTKFQYIILSISRETGAPILIGVQLKQKKENKHPFLSSSSDWTINLLNVTRFDRDAILPRGGGNIDLQDKNVLIIGCGSVGSHLVTTLAKAGVGYLSLVDADQLKNENIHRFAIGFEYTGRKKVDALKEYLAKNLIFTKAISYPILVEELLDKADINLDQYDLIISATGNPTINFLLSQQKWNAPLIIGWNEPFGIGGHSIISFPKKQGCYKCLFSNGYNTASFAAKEQTKPFHKKHLGCGEVFTPYTALDSIRTSELMARMSIDYLKGETNQAEILSWKGEVKDFLSQGFKLSDRYLKQNQVDMIARKFDFKSSDCPYCKTSL